VALRRQPLFGGLVGEEIHLNDVGQIVAQEWRRTGELRPEISLDEFVIMPNHFHAILFINESKLIGRPVGAHRGAHLRREPGSLGAIIAGFKSAASTHAKQKLWQRNYHDRIIRNEDELNKIREYIMYNPLLLSQIIETKPD
jgi:REP element-mobilizing transposase RayT